MNSHRSIPECKALAKEQLLGNYGIAISSFVVIFVIFYSIAMIIIGAYTAGNPGGVLASATIDNGTVNTLEYIKNEIATTVIDLVIGLFTTLFFVGYLHVLMGISTEKKFSVADLFYGFRNNPDKVILIYVIMAAFKIVLLLPSQIVSYATLNIQGTDRNIPVYLLTALAYGIYIYLNVVFAFRYLIYLDDPNMDIKDYYLISAKLMKGNKIRYILIYLSLIGYGILAVLSLGIGMLWVETYRNMIIINFYRDLTEINISVKARNADLCE